MNMARIDNVQVESGRMLQNVSLPEQPVFSKPWNKGSA
jgi:hypothetical protein